MAAYNPDRNPGKGWVAVRNGLVPMMQRVNMSVVVTSTMARDFVKRISIPYDEKGVYDDDYYLSEENAEKVVEAWREEVGESKPGTDNETKELLTKIHNKVKRQAEKLDDLRSIVERIEKKIKISL